MSSRVAASTIRFEHMKPYFEGFKKHVSLRLIIFTLTWYVRSSLNMLREGFSLYVYKL